LQDVAEVACELARGLLVVHVACPVQLVYVAVVELSDAEEDEEGVVGEDEAVEEEVGIVKSI
jgi:hypothetical protein